MKKKSFIILFFSISVVLAVFASKRMSVNEIISENVEALSFDDLGNGLVGIKWPEYAHFKPNDWYSGQTGFCNGTNSSNMWWGIPQCNGERSDNCGRESTQKCWSYNVITVETLMYLLSQGYFFLLID